MFSTCSTITTGFNYCNRSLLKKLNFLDLVCSVHVQGDFFDWSPLNVLCSGSHANWFRISLSVGGYKGFCTQTIQGGTSQKSHPVVTITTSFSYSNRSLLKKWHFLNLICAINVENKNRSLLLKFPLLKTWHFIDLVCSKHVVTITIGCIYSNMSLLKKWHFLDLMCAVYVETLRRDVYLSYLLSLKSGIIWTLYVQYM